MSESEWPQVGMIARFAKGDLVFSAKITAVDPNEPIFEIDTEAPDWVGSGALVAWQWPLPRLGNRRAASTTRSGKRFKASTIRR